MKVKKSIWQREFKGLREFNMKGLKAIQLELQLNLNYGDLPEHEHHQIQYLIKALINQAPDYRFLDSREDLEMHLRDAKPNDLKWKDFETYSRFDFDDFNIDINI